MVEFEATRIWTGEQCYLCGKPIEEGQSVRFYSGPFLIHAACLQKIIEEA